MSKLFDMDTIDAQELALEYNRAGAKFGKAFRHYMAELPVLDGDRFWEILEKYFRPLVVERIYRQDAAKDAISEFFRVQSAAGKVQVYDARNGGYRYEECPYTFDEALRFAKTWGEYKSSLYKPLFEVVEDKGDDGYGDLLDSLVLAGETVHNACHDHDYGDNEEFREAVKDTLEQVVDTQMNKADDERRAKVKKRLVSFVIDGENYFEMRFSDIAQSWFVIWARDQYLAEQEKEGKDGNEVYDKEFCGFDPNI